VSRASQDQRHDPQMTYSVFKCIPRHPEAVAEAQAHLQPGGPQLQLPQLTPCCCFAYRYIRAVHELYMALIPQSVSSTALSHAFSRDKKHHQRQRTMQGWPTGPTVGCCCGLLRWHLRLSGACGSCRWWKANSRAVRMHVRFLGGLLTPLS
jgi:hypothetical protein